MHGEGLQPVAEADAAGCWRVSRVLQGAIPKAQKILGILGKMQVTEAVSYDRSTSKSRQWGQEMRPQSWRLRTEQESSGLGALSL